MPSPDVTTNTLLALTVLVSLYMANKLTLRHVRLRKKQNLLLLGGDLPS